MDYFLFILVAAFIVLVLVVYLVCFLLYLSLRCMRRTGWGSEADTEELHYSRHTFANSDGVIPLAPPGLCPAEAATLPTFLYSAGAGGVSEECTVCLVRFMESQLVRGLPGCNHSFHVECIDEWLLCSATCPLCRSRVKPDSVVIELPPLPRANPSSPLQSVPSSSSPSV